MRKDEKLFSQSIGYSLIFATGVLFSGLWLFWLNDRELEISLEGALEIIAPHLFAMGIFVFVLSHFLLFVEGMNQRVAMKLSLALYLLILLVNIGIYFLWLKVAALFVFTVCFIWLFYKISYSLLLNSDD